MIIVIELVLVVQVRKMRRMEMRQEKPGLKSNLFKPLLFVNGSLGKKGENNNHRQSWKDPASVLHIGSIQAFFNRSDIINNSLASWGGVEVGHSRMGPCTEWHFGTRTAGWSS